MNNLIKKKDVKVATYYFPQWHIDEKNRKKHGYDWTEWETLKEARPKFPGHKQPKVPLWGYEDEADPAVMAGKIDAAADHGIDTFLFDWYWNDKGQFLHRALEEGFMKADNVDRMEFAIMWANHDLSDAKGEISQSTFNDIIDKCVSFYFQHPSYCKLDGSPYFSIYQLQTFIKSFGDLKNAAEAMAFFRARVKEAGFLDLHLNAVVFGLQEVPKEIPEITIPDAIEQLGVGSLDSYVWIHHVEMPGFPATDYGLIKEGYFDYWDKKASGYSIPFHPHVSMGWDSTPRCKQDQPWIKGEYPYFPVLSGNTPDQFRSGLEAARERALGLPEKHRIITINSWNEWTEGSYLEPDIENGMAYLEAVKRVFS